MKYIFVAGAPGSKWSSVCKNIYYSEDIDRSDYSEERTYYHSASGTLELMHIGAYFDPGMEFGKSFDRLDLLSKEECELEFNRPFSGTGIRIIKSHSFCCHIDLLKDRWPDSSVVLVHRPDDACLGWWVKCGHFDITYPRYDSFKDFTTMSRIIASQNAEIIKQIEDEKVIKVNNNYKLCDSIGIGKSNTYHDYIMSDVNVYIR